jgi:HEPN domain-containing protein/predicted nucleotidyltransferase
VSASPELCAGLPAELIPVVKRLVAAVQPRRVILFGSYARGDIHPRSDVDLLVIVPAGRDERQAWIGAWEAARGAAVPCDLVVATEDRVRRYGDLVGTVFRPALQDGMLLYDESARPRWIKSGRRVSLEVDPVTEELRFTETNRWLRQARADLRTAEVSFEREDLDPDPACYLAQQAAEKALKAVLVFLQNDYPFTHDLDRVRDHIPDGWRVKEDFLNLKALSVWSYRARYPGKWHDPTREDAQEATEWARAIYETVLRDLAERGFTPEERS